MSPDGELLKTKEGGILMDRIPEKGECLKNTKRLAYYLGTGEGVDSEGKVRVIRGFESSLLVHLSDLETVDITNVFGIVNGFLSSARDY